jgi:carbonic anhydrase
MNRQLVGRRLFLTAALAAVAGAVGAQRAVAAPPDPVTPAEAFRRLIEGNNRFVAGQPAPATRSPARRLEVATGATPFAAVLACADSRVAPEVLFDQGLGDLYVVRTAGGIADPATVGALELAVERFRLPLIVVLGHERCDAILLAVDTLRRGSAQPGQVGTVVEGLRPAVQLARLRAQLAALRVPPDPEVDVVEEAGRAQVAAVVERLRRAEPVLFPRIQRDQLRVVGLRSDLVTGGVEIVA